jgi:hypothetical protein
MPILFNYLVTVLMGIPVFLPMSLHLMDPFMIFYTVCKFLFYLLVYMVWKMKLQLYWLKA